MQYVPWDELVEFGVRLLTRKGMPQANARYVAEVAVKAEAFGRHTHGVALFAYLDKMLGSEIDAQAEPTVVREGGATALIDGDRVVGQLAMKLAAEVATTKARTEGLAMVAVRNTFWLGALGVHLMPLAEAGFLAQLWAQTSTCQDCAPFGGIDARFSTNPVALAFPTGADPVVADFSTAGVAMGTVAQMIRLGQKADGDLFMDKNGDLTDDPNVVTQGGTILFVGGEKRGHKGYSLSLWCEALAAMAGGRCNDPQAKTRQSFNLTVMDPEAFAGREYYDAEMNRFMAHVKSSRPRPGVKAIRVPGEQGYQSLREARIQGVPLEESTIERLDVVARDNNVPGIPSVGR